MHRTAETVVVNIELEVRFAKLIRRNAYAKARPRIFAPGKYFVDVYAGTRGAAPLARGATIPGSVPAQIAPIPGG